MNQSEVKVGDYRMLENGHIFLWLIKDTCWVTGFRPGGLAMIAPTVGMAIYLTIKSRRVRMELFHNVAICIWISANSVWMTGEFLKREHTFKPVAIWMFFTGLFILTFYYLFLFPADRRRMKAKSESGER